MRAGGGGDGEMKPDRWDVMGLVGLIMVAAGCYLVYVPLALIVPGGLLLVLALVGARNRQE